MERIAIDGGKLDKMRLLFLKDNIDSEMNYLVVDYTVYLEEQVRDLQQGVQKLAVDFVGLEVPARVYEITEPAFEVLNDNDYELWLKNDLEGFVEIAERYLDASLTIKASSCLVVGKNHARLKVSLEGDVFACELPV